MIKPPFKKPKHLRTTARGTVEAYFPLAPYSMESEPGTLFGAIATYDPRTRSFAVELFESMGGEWDWIDRSVTHVSTDDLEVPPDAFSPNADRRARATASLATAAVNLAYLRRFSPQVSADYRERLAAEISRKNPRLTKNEVRIEVDTHLARQDEWYEPDAYTQEMKHGARAADLALVSSYGGPAPAPTAEKSPIIAREVRASALLPPHEVSPYRSNEQLTSLGIAYRRFDPVNPVVVIARKDRKFVGLVGSHRIHALKRVFGKSVVPAKYLLVISEDTARAAFKSSPRLWALLERYLKEQLPDDFPLGGYTELVQGVAKLSPVLAAALADQTPWA